MTMKQRLVAGVVVLVMMVVGGTARAEMKLAYVDVQRALNECRKHGIITGSISCNPDSPVSAVADFPIEVVVGPEFVTGSTRMKSGTAQKLVLNMISTTVMIQLGRVEDNKMVNMQLTNEKLVDRGVKMLMERLKLKDYDKTKQLLLQHGSVKKAAESVVDNTK